MTFIDFFKLILFFCVKRPHIVHIGVFLLSEICKYTMAGNEMHKKGKRNLKNKKLKKICFSFQEEGVRQGAHVPSCVSLMQLPLTSTLY